jgi:mannan endo-1,4-beta-mannosidase
MNTNTKLSPIQPGEFVTRAGGTLLLGGHEFRFVGNNAYFLQPEMAYGNAAGVAETLDKTAALGLAVVRAVGFNDHPFENDPAAIQTAPGVFNEAGFVALDRAVAEAKARHLRLILYLTNNWDAYGGVARYVSWLIGRAPTEAERSLFFTNATVKDWYKNYLGVLLERTNTVTGVRYKDEPAILAWELGNELRNPGGGADALLEWTAEMAAFVKRVDPNHLVADGGEGFDDDASLYPGLGNDSVVRGGAGCSFSRLAAIPDVDLVSSHLYPANWSLNDDSDAEIWIRAHQQIAAAAGKAAYMGEFGKPMKGELSDAARAEVYDRWLRQSLIENNTPGQLVWQLIYDARGDDEGFQIHHPADAETCAVLRRYAALTLAPPA